MAYSNNNNINEEHELGWDDTITNDEGEYQPVPEGDYPFEVVKFERGRSKGKGKLPACNMAILTLKIFAEGRTTTIIENLILHSSVEWKLSAFFRSIGQKKHGEPLAPKWNEVVGSRGRCHIYIDSFTGNDGRPRSNNKIDKFLDPEDNAAAPAANPAAPNGQYW